MRELASERGYAAFFRYLGHGGRPCARCTKGESMIDAREGDVVTVTGAHTGRYRITAISEDGTWTLEPTADDSLPTEPGSGDDAREGGEGRSDR